MCTCILSCLTKIQVQILHRVTDTKGKFTVDIAAPNSAEATQSSAANNTNFSYGCTKFNYDYTKFSYVYTKFKYDYTKVSYVYTKFNYDCTKVSYATPS